MIGTSEKREVAPKPEQHPVASKPEQHPVNAHEVRPSREGPFLQIKEFDQATRKRVKNRVY